MAPARDAATASTSAADGAFVAFLCALAPRELDALYASSPWSALAVLRACDSIAKQIILRLAYVDDGADAYPSEQTRRDPVVERYAEIDRLR